MSASEADAAPPAPAPAPAPAGVAGPIDLNRFTELWASTVKGALRPIVRALYSPLDITSIDTADGTAAVVMSAPTAAHAEKCSQHVDAVAAAVGDALGMAATVSITSGAGAAPTAQTASPAASTEQAARVARSGGGDNDDDEIVDPDELTDAPSVPAPSAEDVVADIFPNTRIVSTDEG